MKLKWKVQSVPTERYRSFERRGWPNAWANNGQLMASLICEDEYYPPNVRIGSHEKLIAWVYDYSQGVQQRKRWRLKETFTTLAEAKTAVVKCLEAHPHFFLQENQQ